MVSGRRQRHAPPTTARRHPLEPVLRGSGDGLERFLKRTPLPPRSAACFGQRQPAKGYFRVRVLDRPSLLDDGVCRGRDKHYHSGELRERRAVVIEEARDRGRCMLFLDRTSLRA